MLPRRPPRLVLLDLDGTLVDHDGAAASAVAAWLTEAGWASPADLPRLVVAWHEVAERHFPAYRARRTTFSGQRRSRLREFLPMVGVDASTWDDEQLDGVFAGYEAAYTRAWTAYEDAVPTLAVLRATAVVGVLSNGDQRQQEAKVVRTGLAALVPGVLTSDGLGVAKPDPGAFTAACAAFSVQPSDAAYVGDRLDVDARAAAAAGLRGVWLDRSGGPGSARAADVSDVDVIASLAELPRLLGLDR